MKMHKSTHKTRGLQETLATLIGASLLAGVLPAMAQLEDPHQRALTEQLKAHVQHIVVVYQENWSFDSLYGQFPGVNGLQNGFDNLPQLEKTNGYAGYIYVTPQAFNGRPPPRVPPWDRPPHPPHNLPGLG